MKTKDSTDPVTDVEMEKVDGDSCDSKEAMEVSKPDLDGIFMEDLKEQAKFIEKFVMTKEPRFIYRVLRALPSTRKKLNARVLRRVISIYSSGQTETRDSLLAYVDELNLKAESNSSLENRVKKPKSPLLPFLPELDVYFHLLVLLHLIDSERYDLAVNCSDLLMEKIKEQNRRSLDILSSKCYFYLARCYELVGRLKDVRTFLHSRLRTATLKNDVDGQATLLNCLLRNYLHYDLFEQASKLVTKSVFPVTASNNEWARFYYYLGRIEAIQLNYSEAHNNILRAIRKAPQATAAGFKQAAHKLLVTIELLLGDIPDRGVFRKPLLRRSLLPYFQLTQAVRNGDLGLFNEVVENFTSSFEADRTYTLIIRLRHNVIRAALRSMSLSYLRIPFTHVAAKLQLDSSEDAEFIVAKAIKDGVIEACIDHNGGYMQSKNNMDIYSTREPQRAFHQRISFCLDIRNQSVKALRFPSKANEKCFEQSDKDKIEKYLVSIDLFGLDEDDIF